MTRKERWDLRAIGFSLGLLAIIVWPSLAQTAPRLGLIPIASPRMPNFLDPVNKEKHTVLQDENHAPVAAKHTQFQFSTTLAPKQTVATGAKFSAPPSGIEKVAIYLPGVPPFEDVVINK